MLLYLFRIEIWTYYSDTIAFRVLFLGVNDNLCMFCHVVFGTIYMHCILDGLLLLLLKLFE